MQYNLDHKTEAESFKYIEMEDDLKNNMSNTDPKGIAEKDADLKNFNQNAESESKGGIKNTLSTNAVLESKLKHTDSNGKSADTVSSSSNLSHKTVISKSEEMDNVSINSTSSSASAVSGAPSMSSTTSVIHGVLCTPCFRANDKVGAVKYCVDCAENYCKPCLRKHIKLNATKAHQLVGKDEMPDFFSKRLKSDIEKCSRHTDLDLDNFCEHHQSLCCDKCAYLEHGTCDHIIDLITATREIDLNTEIEKMKDNVTISTQQLTVARAKRQEDQVSTRQNTAKSLSVIREWRKEANEYLDKLARQPIDVINSTCLEEDNQVNVDVKETSAILEQLQECNKKLRAEAVSDITKFSILQKSKQTVTDANNLNETLAERLGKDQNIFVINNKVVVDIRNIKSIGDFKSSSTGKILVDFQGYFNVCDPEDVEEYADNKCDASDSAKSNNCDIKGITQLADGKIVVADYESKQLRIFSNDFTFERKLPLGRDSTNVSEPFAVCRTGDNQIAVTLERDKVVDVIALVDNRKDTCVHTEIGVGEYCRGLAYSFVYDELFVACGGGSYKGEGLGHVRVFDLQGNHLRSLRRSQSTGKLLLPQPINVAVSPNGETIYVIDREKSIVTLDRHGVNVTYLSSPDIPEPRGVCVDSTGNVVITCQQSNSLVQVLMAGKEFKVLETGSGLLRRPNAVFIDERKSRIIVSMASNQMIAVFNIN